MNLTEMFAIFGIFVVMWWIGRRLVRAIERYDLMKNQCKSHEIAHREPVRRRRSTDRVTVAVQSRAGPRARASGSR